MSPSRSTGVLIVPSGAVAHAVLLACLSGLCPVAAQAGGGMPRVVKVQKDEAGYHLLRDGQPYVIKGGGGRMYLETLKEAGGNSLRTWGEDNLEPLLDRAHELGLTVTIPPSPHEPPGSTAAPTGLVSNSSTTDFLVSGAGTAAHFIWATEDGTIAAWNSGTTASNNCWQGSVQLPQPVDARVHSFNWASVLTPFSWIAPIICPFVTPMHPHTV